MNDAVTSLIRTYVPMGVSILLTLLARELGVVIDEGTSSALVVGASGVLFGVYYGLARTAESRWPWLGVLLGSRKQPVYVKAA